MSGVYLTWLPAEFRKAGLVVIEYDGWQWRARSTGGFTGGRPFGVWWHHTASGPGLSPEDSAYYECHVADARPIANVNIERNGHVWLLAAGATNTNGKGNAKQMSRGMVSKDSANTSVFGMEIANNGGGEPYPQAQIDAAFIVSNTVNRVMGNQPEDVCSHQDYAPTRKIDPAKAGWTVGGTFHPASVNGATGSWSVPDLKAECRRRWAPLPPPVINPIPPIDPKDYDMTPVTNMRVLDTRSGQPDYGKDPVTTVPSKGMLVARKNYKFKPHAKYKLPEGITSYFIHVTVLEARAAGFMQFWPNGGPTMGTGSNGNFAVGPGVTNGLTLVQAGDGIFNFTLNQAAHVTFDIVGFTR